MSSPPEYVLLSHSNLSSSTTTVNATQTLAHPTIRYQFRDDPPLSLLDLHQHVLVMDYDPAFPEQIHVQSLSPQLAITSVKVTDAPGAVSCEDEEPKNTKMYVLETVAHPPSAKGTASDDVPPLVSLASFKQRNALLRKALEYPLPFTPPPQGVPAAQAVSPRPSPTRRPPSLPSTGATT